MTAVFSPEPAIFQAAAAQVRAAKLRSELDYKEIAAPVKIAPHAVAIGAGVNSTGKGTQGTAANIDSPLGAGRLILLHDPAMVDEWGNDFRFVCYAQADMEVDIGTDPFIADVAWSWLMDALNSRNANFSAVAGTATKTISSGYGALANNGEGAQLQLRASWTPGDDNYAVHVEAWSELLCLLAGLPHHEGVASFDAHKSRVTKG